MLKKILYAASTYQHLLRFHMPYIQGLGRYATVLTMANGEGADFDLPFEKKLTSPKNIALIRRIRHIIKREKFDGIVVNTALAAFLIRAALFGMKKRPRVLCVVHGYLFDEKGGMKNRILRLCEKMTAGVTDVIAVMNQQDAMLANRYNLYKEELFSIWGMGFGSRALPTVSRQEARKRLGYTDDDFVCLYVGECSERKNQTFLLEGCLTLAKEGLPIKLLLVGDGATRASLLAQASGSAFPSILQAEGASEDQTFLACCFAAADLYVSASRIEGLPFNILEAMDARLPILASDCKGQTDLLSESGMLYPEGDLQAFTDRLRALCHDPPARHEYPLLDRYRLIHVEQQDLALFAQSLQLSVEPVQP